MPRKQDFTQKKKCLLLIIIDDPFLRFFLCAFCMRFGEKLFFILSNVLKTGPDRPVVPVQPSTGHNSGPVSPIEPLNDQTGHESPKPAVGPMTRWNWTVLIEPNSSS